MLVGERLDEWSNLVSLVVPANLNGNKDRFVWRLRKNGEFSTQSVYREIMKETFGGKDLFGKAKLPLKIKIFLCYLKRRVIVTKDYLLKGIERGRCSFCVLKEIVRHLFFECPTVRFLWNVLFITFNIQPPKNNIHFIWLVA